jgi:hypothetical protein
MWATRPPLPPDRMNVGESPSFTAGQDGCGRVDHTPFTINIVVGDRVPLRAPEA